jgi:hypothetical protein
VGAAARRRQTQHAAAALDVRGPKAFADRSPLLNVRITFNKSILSGVH